VDANTTLQIELLSELRAALADQEEISSEVRENVAGLAVHTRVPGVYVWVFVSYSGRYFSWHNANRQHPVKDVAGAARRIAADMTSRGDIAAGEAGRTS
jgi:hypothetical protein